MKIKTRIKKTVKFMLICALLGIISVIAVNAYIYLTVNDNIISIDDASNYQYDCIIVLGAGVRDDGSPSHMLEDRLKVGIELYKMGCAPKLLMSGDHGREHYDEVGAMLNYARENGVPDDDIFLDHAGFSTYESIYRAKEIFGAEKILIVTQEYHLYRALYIADSFGLDADGVSADLRTYVGQSMREVREIAARFKDFFYTVFKPEPTYLGEKIPLEGSGTVTFD